MAEKQTNPPPPFHKRWNIEIGLDQAREKFMVRVANHVQPFLEDVDGGTLRIRLRLATLLGLHYYFGFSVTPLLKGDFYTCLETLEATHRALRESWMGKDRTDRFVRMLEGIISLSEIDLGIRWKDGVFYPAGAELLDEELVNKPLAWLSDPKYGDVLEPFNKGLSDFLHASNDPQRLRDAVRDMYEALEKMTRIVCGNDQNLKANAEQFVSKLRLSSHYSEMLKEHSEYLHEFRHAAKQAKARKLPSSQEVEASIYMTGLFLRLAIERLASKQ